MKYTYSNFYSSINKMPKIGDEKPSFYAVVDVTVPSGGYDLTIEKDHVKDDVIYLRVGINRPNGVVTQALVTHKLRYEEELDREYKSAVLIGPIDQIDVQVTR